MELTSISCQVQIRTNKQKPRNSGFQLKRGKTFMRVALFSSHLNNSGSSSPRPTGIQGGSPAWGDGPHDPSSFPCLPLVRAKPSQTKSCRQRKVFLGFRRVSLKNSRRRGVRPGGAHAGRRACKGPGVGGGGSEEGRVPEGEAVRLQRTASHAARTQASETKRGPPGS